MTVRECGSPRWALPLALFLMMIAAPQWLSSTSTPGDSFVQNNLVSDIPGLAANTDPNLANPWGISFSSSSPFWVSDNKTGLATLYNTAGQPQGLVVTIPPPLGGTSPSAPTGQVFNPNSSDFLGARFIFATEDGTISSWQGGTSATLNVDNSASGAVYKGLALGSNGSASFLYAANFHNGTVDVFDSSFKSVNLSGAFTDPNLPSGYAPFDIKNIDGKLYVTFALQDADKHDDVPGPGHGFVDVFDTNGSLLQRLITQGSLNSPWGLAVAPSGFGEFGNDLLVGNFGDGTINAFDPVTGMPTGQLDDASGNPIVNLGLWGLTFGNGGNGGNLNALYFTAGIPGDGAIEDHGLFGSLGPTPEPGTWIVFGSGVISLLGYGWRRKAAG
jgi:uncharacterized protein (TIGR03118 family)